MKREKRRGNFIVFRFASRPTDQCSGRQMACHPPPHAAARTSRARAHLVRDANCKLRGKRTFFKAKSSRTLSHICSVAISCILLAYTLCSAGGSLTNTGDLPLTRFPLMRSPLMRFFAHPFTYLFSCNFLLTLCTVGRRFDKYTKFFKI